MKWEGGLECEMEIQYRSIITFLEGRYPTVCS